MASWELRRDRVVAAAIVLAIHGAAYWWLVTESLRPSMGPTPRQFDLILIPSIRSSASTVINTSKRESLARAVARAARGPAQAVRSTISELQVTPSAPRPRGGAPIDWDWELKREAQVAISDSQKKKWRDFGFPHQRAERTPKTPTFGWDYARIHRVEILPGAILIHLGQRCVLALVPLPLVGCAIGKIRVNGDLFNHLHDSHDPLDQSLP